MYKNEVTASDNGALAVLEPPTRTPANRGLVDSRPSERSTPVVTKSREPGRKFLAAAGGNPPPFVVARGEDSLKVFDEVLKHTGFFEQLEKLLLDSGKRRETFEIACKVDFLHATRKEDPPVSYVDPKLVAHLFNQILDRGFRLVRVVEKTNELSRYLKFREAQEAGRLLGYDESCYELRDLSKELVPTDFGAPLGLAPTGKTWLNADCRIVFAKNRTHESLGAALILYNLLSTLASPTDLLSFERDIKPEEILLGTVQAMPVHYAIIDAVYSRDGSVGSGGPFDLLTDPDGNKRGGGEVHKTDIILGGRDYLAVEAAGRRMQGLAPAGSEFFKMIRRSTGYAPPKEVNDLPVYEGWNSLGAQIQEVLDIDKPVEAYRFGLWQILQNTDLELFPAQPGGWLAHQLTSQVETYLEEVRARQGGDSVTAADPGAA